jgi:hypothetical protein
MHSPNDPSPNVGGAERRRSPRVDVRIDMAGQLSSCRVRISNVSAGGCLVFASCMLAAGDVHQLRFNTSPDRERVTLQVRVVYAVPVGGDPDVVCAAGLEFTSPEAAEQTAIDALVALAENAQA